MEVGELAQSGIPQAGSLPEPVSGAGCELGWLVTVCKPRDEGVDESDEGVDALVVVDLLCASGSPQAHLLPICSRAAMMRARRLG